MKTIFITGASTGLGNSTAHLFAARGWHVIATMRHPEHETELRTLENVSLLPLDVTDEEAIQKAVEAAVAISPVDVVFNNAGYGLVGPLEGLSHDQITRQFNTNVLGAIFVTQAFLPHLREKQSGLILNTTSIGGLVTFPLSSIYHATKWALEGWSESMSFELGLHGIRIKTISPGGIATDFMGRSLDAAQHDAYAPLFEKLMGGFSSGESTLQFSPPETIAEVVYEAATDGKDQLRYLAGPDAVATYAQRLKVGPEPFRQGVAAQFGV
ncbi:NADP-dependent 3-hydroxy acid dehydrogenase YdfG [Catalinimonas alkaloidigena]|uniref:NADP-dependent 3-hydroxy acid dehydrogenase YdfG n=1 Tax=Catalinimonas alkaloidigena TaxID=1075417 RepID=A0A1G9TYA3_9BACT|nr:SDR family oxidoreductase [Catalinimonas alkaloidigena]SDM52225.1 NADP-dependent 3-hydroxy acid dehydrogenase YdfG [Catalinimonas alkaloidigena]